MGRTETEVAIGLLERAGVELTPGLSEDELTRIETTFGFTFGDDHRDLLKAAVPVGQYWATWRDFSDPYFQWQLTWPVEGALFDVEENAFWPSEWGPRPAELAAALATARPEIEKWPRLVPICQHSYTVAASRSGSPVFSVHQTDVITDGADLNDYLRRRFHLGGELDYEEAARASDLFPWSVFEWFDWGGAWTVDD